MIDILIELQQHCHLIPILGNHDELMLDSRNDRHAEERWRHQGRTETLKSYGDLDSTKDVPQSHWDFLESCRPYFETVEFVFTHANYCWYSALEDQPPSLLRWLSLEESPPRAHLNGKTFVLGHTPGPIRDYGFCRCLDTGCGFGGKLTAMEIASKELWQVSEIGHIVM